MLNKVSYAFYFEYFYKNIYININNYKKIFFILQVKNTFVNLQFLM